MKEELNHLIILYRKLCADVENGLISFSEFRRQINTAAVQDESEPGCWWNISHDTGEWLHYNKSAGWIVKAPEGFPLIAGAPPKRRPQYAPDIGRPTSTSARTPVSYKRGLPMWAIVLIAISSFFILMTVLSVMVFPSFSEAMDRSKQATSVANVAMMGMCVERYIQDHPKIGCPRVKSIIALQIVLEEAGLNCNEKLVRDGWGNLLEYEFGASLSNRLFSITSYGSDGLPGPDVYFQDLEGRYIVKRFEEDIIYNSGRFTQYPQGASTTTR